MKCLRLVKSMSVAVAILAASSAVDAATVTLAWDPSADTTVNNYAVFVGTSPGSWAASQSVGMRTSWTFPGLADNRTYYFGVQAQSASGGSAIVQIAYTTPPPIAPGSEPSRSDFNGDFNFDLVWQHQTTGQIVAWHMNGDVLATSRWFTPDRVTDTTWKIVGSADFNSDGKPDLVWKNESSGQIVAWMMDGVVNFLTAGFTPDRVSDTNWKIAAVNDFNGDKKPDLVWQNRANGQLAVWFLDGTRATGTQWLSISQVTDTNWRIAGSADLNRDGIADLVWQHLTTGQLAVWYMSGASVIGTAYLSPGRVSDPQWRIASIGDVDHDGWADLIWRHYTTGQLAIWYLNGASVVATRYLTPDRVTEAAWQIAGPR